MQVTRVIARHYQTGQAVSVRWKEGYITRLAPISERAAPNLWLAPVLFDLQINGFAGIDFQQDRVTADDLLQACRGLRLHGCGRFLLTLITDEWPRMMARLRQLRELRIAHKELEAAIAGWHIEGPFLSPKPGFHGAHNPEFMKDPSVEAIKELEQTAAGDAVMLTLAPERPGSISAIQTAVEAGMRVSLGHTDADLDSLQAAARAGATGFTHLGNGCPRELDRSDNILWRVLEMPELFCGLIPDRIHVSPHLFRLFHRILRRDKIYFTTDAMSAAGASPGHYRLGKLEIEVGTDQVVRKPGEKTFAGSALRPIDGIARAAEMLGTAWQEVWDFFSIHPANFMGQLQLLASGLPADFCLISVDSNNRIQQVQNYYHGTPQEPSRL